MSAKYVPAKPFKKLSFDKMHYLLALITLVHSMIGNGVYPAMLCKMTPNSISVDYSSPWLKMEAYGRPNPNIASRHFFRDVSKNVNVTLSRHSLCFLQ